MRHLGLWMTETQRYFRKTTLNYDMMNTQMCLRDTATDKVTDFRTQHIINSLTKWRK